jgi:hypothetical protein
MSLVAAALGVGGPVETETEPCAHAHTAAAEDRCRVRIVTARRTPMMISFIVVKCWSRDVCTQRLDDIERTHGR